MKNNHNVKLYKNISISFFRKCIAVLHFVSFGFIFFGTFVVRAKTSSKYKQKNNNNRRTSKENVQKRGKNDNKKCS